MEHIRVAFALSDTELSEILIALLSDLGYEGFEQGEQDMYAYIARDAFDEVALKEVAEPFNVEYTTGIIAAQNWNALWESNFHPVIVEDFCTIRAHFHDIAVTTLYEVLITPKMSFGTGHHATTRQMLLQMRDMSFTGKSVLDFGTGTGILAIVAELLGAKEVLAIDNDEWSVENTTENIDRNNCSKITVKNGTLDIAGDSYDIILANINRHILLQYMANLYARTKIGGFVLMSGLLTTDKDIVTDAALAKGLSLTRFTEQDNWISLLFTKTL